MVAGCTAGSEHDDLPGEAGVHDAVGTGRGQVVGAAQRVAGQPEERGSVRAGDDLDVHAVPAMSVRHDDVAPSPNELVHGKW